MTDNPDYNEKEISMKDISFVIRAIDWRKTSGGRLFCADRFTASGGILKSLCKCISYTRYIINDASVDKNQHNLGEIKG